MAIQMCHIEGGFSYSEDAEGYNLNLAEEESTGHRRLTVAWADALDFADYLRNANNVTDAGITYQVGATHPHMDHMYVESVNIRPSGMPVIAEPPTTDAPTWEYAILEVDYDTSAFDPNDPQVETLREETLTLVSEVKQIEGYIFKIGGKNLEGTKTYMQSSYRYTVAFKTTAINMANIEACVNKFHNGNMTIRLGNGTTATVPTGHCLYEGPSEATRRTTTQGTEKWYIAHNFLITRIHVNHEFDPKATDANLWERFKLVDPPKYEATNLAVLGV